MNKSRNTNKSKIIRKANHSNVPPLINNDCTTLILGTMLSPESAKQGFYYAHPQNRFWRVLFALFNSNYSAVKEEQAEFALSHGIALWDVIESCDIVGAADNTIANVTYNDIVKLLTDHPKITRIFALGGKAYTLLRRYNKTANDPIISQAIKLPSTSPLNCAYSLDKLIESYSIIVD